MYISEQLPINVGARIFSIEKRDYHKFPNYQFFAIQRGSIVIEFTEDEETIQLSQGDVLLVEPNRSFYDHPVSENTTISVQFDAVFLNNLLETNQSFSCNSTRGLQKDYQALYRLLNQICSDLYSSGSHYHMLSLVYQLCDQLTRDFIVTKDRPHTTASDRLQSERIFMIENYLQNGYQHTVSLDELAEQMFLTPQYLSKFIKKHFNKSFKTYLTDIRLGHAYEELVNTDHSITAIALNNGFPNTTAFNKAFRDAYDLLPSTFRGQNQNLSDNIITYGSSDAAYVAESESSLLESIQINAEHFSPLAKPWESMINIGSLQNALNISFHDNFEEYHHYIPTKYVRFYDIFSDNIVSRDPVTMQFYFSTLDEIIAFFIETGVLPFIELHYKEPDQPTFFNPADSSDQNRSSEEDILFRCDFLRNLLVHCIDQFGYEYVSKWKFELWWPHNEQAETYMSMDSYFDLFLQYSRIIKSIIPACQIGGCGYNACADSDRFVEFLEAARNQSIPFDFLSFHAYSHQVQNMQYVISLNPDNITDHFIRCKALAEKYYRRDIPVCISEMGLLSSPNNQVSDSVFHADFLCNNMLQLSAYCQSAAYSDFEHSEKSALAGLIDENGVPFPAMHGYFLLSKLGKNLIGRGKNYVMTNNSQNHFQLLFYRYVHPKEAFCFNPTDSIAFQDTYSVFPQEAPQQIHFACDSFPAGRYRVIQYTLDQENGSLLDKIIHTIAGMSANMEIPESFSNLKKEEVRYYKQTSLPKQDIYYITTDTTLSLDLTLNSHEMVFYDFSRVL